MILMKKISMFLLSIGMIFVLFSCKGDDPVTPEEELVLTRSVTVQNHLNTNAKCFLNAYDGVAYNKTEAAAQPAAVDFIFWQYTGTSINKDCYFKSPLQIHNDASGAGELLETELGIHTWTTWKDAIISNSDITEAQFDAIKTKAELNTLFSQNTHGLVNYHQITDVLGPLLYKVFIFQDKNGKKGFLKVKTITTGTTGSMAVDIKIIK
jgi:hypothetical protein